MARTRSTDGDMSPLIVKMAGKRSDNNKNWMLVLRGFCKYAPKDEVRRVLNGINALDQDIQEIWGEMVDAIERTTDGANDTD